MYDVIIIGGGIVGCTLAQIDQNILNDVARAEIAVIATRSLPIVTKSGDRIIDTCI